MDIRIEGSANFSQVREQFARLKVQVAQLNAELARTGIAAQGVNPQGFRQAQAAMRASSAAFRDSAASSGQFLTQQVRLNSATEDMTKRLMKQKVGVREMWKERSRLTEVYREQVRLQNMYVRQAPSMSTGGRGAYDIAVPRQVSSELNTINSRLGFANSLIKSASTSMVNWGKNTQWAGRQLMVGFTVPMAAFGAAAGVMAYQVDKEMTRIAKVYDTTAQRVQGDNASMIAVEQELAAVRQRSMQTAMDVSHQYGIAAKDTLALQAELAATGLKGEALQKSTSEAMRISALGELDYQSAANTTIALQTAFKMSTQELTEAFDFMNATENATSLSIQDIAEATPRAASAMSALGVSAKEMTVLLVSMREAGVDAAEGANALKSATGTILAPSPAADKFIKQVSEGRVQVTKLAEESNGNLYVALKMLAEQMNGLDQVAKQQILVKLFGKYQFNRVSAMLYNLEDAVNGVGNQTKTAMDLMGNSAADNAAKAAQEIKIFQESVSGKFKRGLEDFKNEMIQMGEPFLQIGIYAIKALGAVGKFFNSLPSGLKQVIAGGAILLAIAGPITMLVGLFANMVGTLLGFARAIVLFGNKAGLVTKESKAMELASAAATSQWDRQTTAVMGLTKQLEILTAAQIASQRAANGLPMTMANGKPVGSAPVNIPIANPNHFAASAVPWTAPGGTGSNVNPQQAAYLATVGAQMQNNLQVQEDTTRAAEQEAKNRQRTQRFLAGSAMSAGVMAGAMATMAVSNNKTVDQYAMMALTAAMIIPLLNQATGALKTMLAARRANLVTQWEENAAAQAQLAQQRAIIVQEIQMAMYSGAINAEAAQLLMIRSTQTGQNAALIAQEIQKATIQGVISSEQAIQLLTGQGLVATQAEALALELERAVAAGAITAEQATMIAENGVLLQENSAIIVQQIEMAAAAGLISAETAATLLHVGGQIIPNATIITQQIEQAALAGTISAESAAILLNTVATGGAATATTGRIAAMQAALVGAGKGSLGLLKSMGSLIGVTGAIVIALGAAYAVHKMIDKAEERREERMKKAYDSQLAVAKSMNTAADYWASTIDRGVKGYDQFANQLMGVNPTSLTGMQNKVKDWKAEQPETKDGKNHVDTYKALGDEIDRANYELKLFSDLQVKSGLNSEQAAAALQAFYIASGLTFEDAAYKAQTMLDTWGNFSGLDKSMKVFRDALDYALDGTEAEAYERGKSTGEAFGRALSETDSPEQVQTMYTEIADAVEKKWKSTYEAMASQGREASDMLATLNIKSYQDFLNFIDQHGVAGLQKELPKGYDLNIGFGTTISEETLEKLRSLVDEANNFEKGISQGAAATQGLGENIVDIEGLFGNNRMRDYLKTYDQIREEAISANKAVAAAEKYRKETRGDPGPSRDLKTRTLINMQMLAASHNIKQSADYATQLDYILRNVKDTTQGIVGGLNSMNMGLRNALSFSDQDWKTALQNGLQAQQEAMAAQAEKNYDEAVSTDLDKWQEGWNDKLARQQDTQEKQQDAMANRHEKEMNRFDDRWDIRKKRVSDYWDARTEKVEQAIKAEQKAEEIRQKIFDAEMTRLDRLNDAANRNIDFNVALNSGNFDEAAKIRNDAEAQFADYSLQDAAAASATGSDARVDRLQGKSDSLGKQKDKALEELDKIEEQQRKSLETRQQAEEDHLKKMQDIRVEALKDEADADMKSRKQTWELDKISYMKRVDLFKSFHGRSMEELLAWADQVGIKYEDFGDKRLKPMGQDWAQYFREELANKIELAGNDVASSKMWEDMAAKEARSILRGFGFNGLESLKKFMRTGEMKETKKQKIAKIPAAINPFHVGGEIGKDKGGRNGVARTQKGMGPRERLVLARDGEFMVNERSYRANKDLIHNINNSSGPVANPNDLPRGIMGGGGKAYASPALASAIMYKAMSTGIKQTLTNGYRVGKQKQKTLAPTNFATGIAGAYGDMEFSAEQLNNARTIANVGRGMGMSVRDIQIGIMTAITESMLKNIQFGDRDSLGLFQQRPSQGWGTPEQVTNPEYASRKFFQGLRGIESRKDMAPWLAAQAVQRSAFADGSNYKKYWNEAQAIFRNGLTSVNSGNTGNGAFGTPGKGGRHRPVNNPAHGGLHDLDTGFPGIDFPLPTGTPVYAVGNGKITESAAYRGYEPRRIVRGQSGQAVQDGYRSYGRYMKLKLDSGPTLMYAHLSAQGPTGRVTGGTQIGKVGNTGYVMSSAGDGSHLHFGSSDGNPLQFLANGGTTIGKGLAYLHDQETVLTKPLSKDLVMAVKGMGIAGRKLSSPSMKLGRSLSLPGSSGNLANNTSNTYNLTVNANGTGLDEREIANIAIQGIKRIEARKPRSRKG